MGYKVIIWGCGGTYQKFSENIYHEMNTGRIEIIGFTGSNTVINSIDGYRFIEKAELANIEFDYIVVAVGSNSLQDIYHEMGCYGITRDKFVRADVFSLPNFNFEKYLQLRKKPVTIISQLCFGGVLYKHMDLPFSSPTIDMLFSPNDFIKFCIDLPKYLSIQPRMDHMTYHSFLKAEYPVVALDDVMINFIHYTSMGEASEKWCSRREKVNFDNILVVMKAETPEMLTGFQDIPYRKVCFTEFRSNVPDTYYCPVEKGKHLWETVIELARGQHPTIDPLRFMLGEPDFMRCEYK